MELSKNILSILSDAGLGIRAEKIQMIAMGGNNQVFKISAGDKNYIIKSYFAHKDDHRSRLENELAFLSYAQKVAPQWVPKTIAWNKKDGLALYEFIDGKRYTSSMIGWKEVESAAHFFLALNNDKESLNSDCLPLASESCFSLIDHILLVKKRICCLESACCDSEHNKSALLFIRDLKQEFSLLESRIIYKAKKININPYIYLANNERCVSPSDFGFHNALMNKIGMPVFFDFEYAGWDDPAKMAADFFAQLSVPVPANYFEDFVKLCMSRFPESEMLIIRSHLLRKLYNIKWCCIAMNVFLPINLARRKFANPLTNVFELKKNQLMKAINLLESIRKEEDGLY